MESWTFLTNHARVLLCITREPGIRIREIAACVGVQERAAHRIVGELAEAGYLTRHRVGARNFYEVHPELPMRHPNERSCEIGQVLAVLGERAPGGPTQREPRGAARSEA